MPLALSLYLDVVRFLAAIFVLLDHVSSAPITSNVFWPRLGQYGAISVMVFFVLSGYVIAYVSSTREKTASAYFGSRVSRLYSVVIPALILTFLFDMLGMAIDPDLYKIQKILWKPESWAGYASSLFFVNEYQIFDFGGISPGTNGPYWSLSFEAAYYVVAGLVLFSSVWVAVPAALLIFALAGKTIAALFPVWLLGFFLYRYRDRIKVSRNVAVAGFILSLIALVLLPNIGYRLPNDNFGHFFPWGRAPFNRNLALDYTAALIFGAHLVCARNLAPYITIKSNNIAALIRWFGGLTFPLYCLHYPALCLFRAVRVLPENSWMYVISMLLFVFALTVALTKVSDKLKTWIRERLDFVTRGFAQTAA